MIRDKSGEEVWYQTVGNALCTSPSYLPIGRGIRVWKVREVDVDGSPRGEEMVLKDFWIPEDSKTEGQIQAEIFQSAREELSDETDPDGFKKYFMTIVHDTVEIGRAHV